MEHENTISESKTTGDALKVVDIMGILNTYPFLQTLTEKLSGYQKQTNKGRVRIIKPKFSDEFVFEIQTKLLMHLNQVTMYTSVPKESITAYIIQQMRNFNRLLYQQGRDHYISDLNYLNIIKVHKEKYKRNVFDESEKKDVLKTVSGWYDIVDDDWNIHKPITKEMIDHVKVDDLKDNFDVTARDLWLEVYSLIKSSLYMGREIADGMGNLQAHSQNTQNIRQANINVIGKKNELAKANSFFSNQPYSK